jgi:hypothetical protein
MPGHALTRCQHLNNYSHNIACSASRGSSCGRHANKVSGRRGPGQCAGSHRHVSKHARHGPLVRRYQRGYGPALPQLPGSPPRRSPEEELNVDEYADNEVEQQERYDQERVLAALARSDQQEAPQAASTGGYTGTDTSAGGGGTCRVCCTHIEDRGSDGSRTLQLLYRCTRIEDRAPDGSRTLQLLYGNEHLHQFETQELTYLLVCCSADKGRRALLPTGTPSHTQA